MEELTRKQRLSADIDLRLVDLMQYYVNFEDDMLRDLCLQLVRCAYAKGYEDAWTEERKASLYVDHGYSIPVAK